MSKIGKYVQGGICVFMCYNLRKQNDKNLVALKKEVTADMLIALHGLALHTKIGIKIKI